METILLTGVTSSIGEELALFLSKKYRIILSGRDNNKLSNLSNKLYGENHIIWSCDFVNENISPKRDEIHGRFFDPYGLVASAF